MTAPRPGARARAAAWIATLLSLGALWPFAPVQPLGAFDQPFYLGIAADLLHTGRFTDGVVFGGGGPTASRPPGMRFGPLYPALLAGLATVDPVFRHDMDCESGRLGAGNRCSRRAPSVRWLQWLLLAATEMAVWRIARRVTGDARTAAVALGLALAASPVLLASVNYAMTEIVTLALTTFFTEALLRSVTARAPSRGGGAAAAAGVLLGLATLTRPGFLYLAPAIVAALAWRAARRRHAILFGSAFLLAIAPWVARNWLVLGHANVSFGYAAHTLAQRISFDRMSGREYALSLLCWLPDGNGLGGLLIGPHACWRFGWNENPDTFYAIGMDRLVPATRAAAGSAANWLPYLMRHDVLAHPFVHAATTLPLALRGLWIDRDWGLVLGPIALVLTARAVRHGDDAFAAVTLPGWFMLVFNASVAVNQPRYNLMLIPPLAIAGATAAVAGWLALRRIRS